MSGSIVVYGANKNLRKEKTLEIVTKLFKKTLEWGDLNKNPDIKVLEIPSDRKSIGIASVREVTKYLGEKPYSEKNKLVIVNDANTLTTEAQNALLKTLEEPPSYASIILVTKTLNDLLGTVISRCKKIEVFSKNDKFEEDLQYVKDAESYSKVLNLSDGEKLDWANEISKLEKEEVLEILEKWVAEARESMIDSSSTLNIKNIKLILLIKRNIESTNTGLRLALESLVMSLEK